MSNRQHLLHFIVYNILTIDFRSFHALRTWKVYVVMFSYHVTHFHSLLTCAPLDFRYFNARFDIRCNDSSTNCNGLGVLDMYGYRLEEITPLVTGVKSYI